MSWQAGVECWGVAAVLPFGIKKGNENPQPWEQRILLHPLLALKIPIGNQAPAARLCVSLVAGAHQALRYK